MNKWFTKSGGLYRNSYEANKLKGKHIENGFLNRYNLFKLTGEGEEDLKKFLDKVAQPDPVSGKIIMQNHFAPEVLKGESEMSHDQYDAYIMASKDLGTNHHKMMWDDTKFFKYDDRSMKWRSIFTAGIINNAHWVWLLFPFILPALVWSYLFKYAVRVKPDWKGEQVNRQLRVWTVRGFIKNSEPRLWLLRAYHYPAWLASLVRALARWRFGSVSGVYRSYFEYDKKHPILKELATS